MDAANAAATATDTGLLDRQVTGSFADKLHIVAVPVRSRRRARDLLESTQAVVGLPVVGRGAVVDAEMTVVLVVVLVEVHIVMAVRNTSEIQRYAIGGYVRLEIAAH